MNINKSGFTIVELLIVIVVIAVLAAITIVAFNGVQARATNTSVLSAASQINKLLKGYITTNSAFPDTSAGGCIVLQANSTGCSSGTANNNGLVGNAVTNLRTIGTAPAYVPAVSVNKNGILYLYNTSRTMDGQPAPLIIYYYLKGDAVSCGGFGNLADGNGTTLAKATNPYTATSSGITECSLSYSLSS